MLILIRNYLFRMNEYKLNINYFLSLSLSPLIINNRYLSQILSFMNDYYHKYHSEYIFKQL